MSGDNSTDFLINAVQANAPVQNLMAPRPYSPLETKAVAEDASAKASEAAEATKEKLAQEALLADPAEMRKLFPQVLKDVSLNHTDHLDMAEIQNGLQNGKLPQEERNFLKVMEFGYDNFRWEPTVTAPVYGHFDHDQEGVSARSLAMLDKAADRKIPEDPYFSYSQTPTAIASFVVNGLLGAGISSLYNDSPKEMAFWAAFGAVSGAVGNEWRLYSQRSNGSEDKMYDEIKTGYQSFVADYHNGKLAKPANAVP